MAMMIALRQMAGMSACAIDRLKRWVKYWIPAGPRWRRWWMLRLSGPSAVEVPDSFMASRTSCGVKGLKLWSRDLFRIDPFSCRIQI